MAAKKKEVYEFPPESCGCCKFYHDFNHGDTCCLAMPAHVSYDDSDGAPYYQRGVPAEPQDPVCAYFKHRTNA